MPTKSDIAAKTAEIHKIIQSKGMLPEMIGTGRGSFKAWVIKEGKVSIWRTPPKDPNPRHSTSTTGQIILTSSGELWTARHSYGFSEETGSFSDIDAGPMSMEEMVGSTGAPFSALNRVLERWIAIHS